MRLLLPDLLLTPSLNLKENHLHLAEFRQCSHSYKYNLSSSGEYHHMDTAPSSHPPLEGLLVLLEFLFHRLFSPFVHSTSSFFFLSFFTNLSVNTLDPMIIQVQSKEHLNLISASIKCLVGLCLGADTSILGDSGSLLLLPTQWRHPGAHYLESHLRKAILHKITDFL